MIVNKYKYGGGGSGSGSTYTAGEYIQIAEDVISVTGITPDLYLTTADTQDLVTEAYVDAAITAGTQGFITSAYTGFTKTEDFDELVENLEGKEEVVASALTQLENSVLEISGSTPDLSNYYTKAETDAEITGATQGLATEAYVTAATQGFATQAYVTAATSPIQTQLDDIERVTATAYTELHDAILEISGSTPDLSNYFTKAETDAEITGATQGLATQAYVTAATQGLATQAYVTAATQGFITSAYTGFTKTEDFDDLVDMVETKEEVIASALTQLENSILEISGDTQVFATEAYVTGITSPIDTRLHNVEMQMPGHHESLVMTQYGNVEDGQGQIIAYFEPVNYVVKCTQSDYDALEAAGLIDSTTFYIIVENQGE